MRAVFGCVDPYWEAQGLSAYLEPGLQAYLPSMYLNVRPVRETVSWVGSPVARSC